jgi:alanyl-tRNA synthetase
MATPCVVSIPIQPSQRRHACVGHGDIGSFGVGRRCGSGASGGSAPTNLGATPGPERREHRRDHAVEALERLQAEVKRLTRDLTLLKTKLAMGGGSAADGDDTTEVSGIKVVRRRVTDLDKGALRTLADSLKAKVKSGIVILASEGDGKVQVVVAVTPDLVSRIKAGHVVKEIAPIVGGGGGGRPTSPKPAAHPEKIAEMLEAALGIIQKY